MDNRKLGDIGPEVAEVGFGCMGLTSNYGETDDDSAIRTVNRAIDLGVTHCDTADTYGWGDNEILVGKALKDRRSEVTIATKFGQLMRDGERVVCGTPEYVKSACDASLKRLGIDTIDLYYAHRIDPNVPVEETVGAMSELVSAGKVRWLGLSEATADTVRRGHAVHPIAALQAEYSLWTRFAEVDQFDVCEALGMAFVAYAPLGRVSSPEQSSLRAIFEREIVANPIRGSSQKISTPTSPRSTRYEMWLWRSVHPRLRLLWPGCWQVGPSSTQFPAQRRLSTSRRTSQQPRSRFPRNNWRGSRHRSPRWLVTGIRPER